MRVGIYARVSTKDQNVETQLRELRQYCAARSWAVEGEFIDIGMSGAKDDRPALKELMHYARTRRIDSVLVWRFDRFARSLRHLIVSLSELRELGVDFVSFSEALDTSTSHGRLVFNVVGAIAEFERDIIRERVLAGLRNARAAGIRLGRPGSDFDVAKARQLRAKGRSLRVIAKKTGATVSTLHRLFQIPINNYVTLPTETKLNA